MSADLIRKLEDDAQALDAASTALPKAIRNASEVERDYLAAVQTELITIYNAAKEGGERMPAEDVRRAIAHSRIEPKVFGDHLLAKAEVEALTASVQARRAAANARQTLVRVEEELA